jgi:UDP-N-acetylmuramyl pentapeptide phosphotransferase/UDP-N-acetylglucosamine-1-phosphate transferase
MSEWKLLISGGTIGLLLSSVLVLIVLYRLSPRLQSRREKSLRDQHGEPVSRFGGVALFWGFALSVLIQWLLPFEQRGLDFHLLSETRFAGLCIGAFAAWVLGFCDDIFQLRARWKLVGQIVISLIAIVFGFEIKILQLPMLTINLGFWSWPITILWIVGIMNSINLIDGLDGLASGLAIIALSCMALICWWMNNLTLLLLIMTLIGVTIGFWSFNRPQATIFMGDSGSLFLGYSVAVLSLWVQ